MKLWEIIRFLWIAGWVHVGTPRTLLRWWTFETAFGRKPTFQEPERGENKLSAASCDRREKLTQTQPLPSDAPVDMLGFALVVVLRLDSSGGFSRSSRRPESAT